MRVHAGVHNVIQINGDMTHTDATVACCVQENAEDGWDKTNAAATDQHRADGQKSHEDLGG